MQHTQFDIDCNPPSGHLRIAGDLDLCSITRLHEALDLFRDRDCGQLDVDLRAVTYLSAAAVLVLRNESRRLSDAGGRMHVLAGMRRRRDPETDALSGVAAAAQ